MTGFTSPDGGGTGGAGTGDGNLGKDARQNATQCGTSAVGADAAGGGVSSNPTGAAVDYAAGYGAGALELALHGEPDKGPGCSGPIEDGLFAPGEDNLLDPLSVRQVQAVEMIVGGQPDREVARRLRVHRGTVARWRLHHPRFQAALNRRRQEVWGAAADRFRSLLDGAVGVLEEQLCGPDPRARLRAAAVMLGLASRGRFVPPADDPTDIRGALGQFAREQHVADHGRDPRTDRLTDDDFSAALMELARRSGTFRRDEERPELDAVPLPLSGVKPTRSGLIGVGEAGQAVAGGTVGAPDEPRPLGSVG